MPDVDIDFCIERRGEVIDYVIKKYGKENVSQIITFGTMKAKQAAVRDVGRALNLSYAEADKVAKAIPFELKMTIDKSHGHESGAERQCTSPMIESPRSSTCREPLKACRATHRPMRQAL